MTRPEEFAERYARERRDLIEVGRTRGFLCADLHLLASCDGGRRHPVHTGYRSCWHWGETNDEGLIMCYDAPLLVEESDVVEPGSSASIRLFPLSPEFWRSKVPGDRIELREGPILIGDAVITHVSLPAR